jgi:hypothetical protein
MLLAFLLAHFKPRFAWRPALDFSDLQVYSALIPGTQY